MRWTPVTISTDRHVCTHPGSGLGSPPRESRTLGAPVSSIAALIDRLDREAVLVGGEDALAAAFGAALDNPGVVAVCVVGESRAWHLAPEGGTVLPVLPVAGHPVYGGLSDDELSRHFAAFGWQAVFDPDAVDLDARPLLIV